MIVKTTGNGAITQYHSLELALRANDPFQRYARHVGSAFPWLAWLEIGGAGANGQVLEINQFEQIRPLL